MQFLLFPFVKDLKDTWSPLLAHIFLFSFFVCQTQTQTALCCAGVQRIMCVHSSALSLSLNLSSNMSSTMFFFFFFFFVFSIYDIVLSTPLQDPFGFDISPVQRQSETERAQSTVNGQRHMTDRPTYNLAFLSIWRGLLHFRANSLPMQNILWLWRQQHNAWYKKTVVINKKMNLMMGFNSQQSTQIF